MMVQDYFEDVVIMDKRTHNDAISGTSSSWVEGAKFKAGVVVDNSTAAKVAYQNGAQVMYTIVYSDAVELSIGDRVKRVKDGTIMVVKSSPSDMSPPPNVPSAMMAFRQVRAEAVKV